MEQSEINTELWTIELNCDDNPITDFSWHIDTLEHAMERNIRDYLQNIKTSRWMLVGLAPSQQKAGDLIEDLHKMIQDVQKDKEI